MRHGSITRWAVPLATAAALLTPQAAAAAANPPTITSAFTPPLIGIGSTTTLAFTITNPNTSSLSGIGFTDALPTGVVVDNPNGENGTCGTSGAVTAVTGSSTISLTGGSLKASSNCVVSVNVTSTTPGLYKNNTGPVTSTEGGASASGDTESLTVAGNPTITVTAPRNNATFSFGQKVSAKFACAEAANGPGLVDCSVSDDNGNTIEAPGGLIDTKVAGPGTLTFSATSADGLIVTQSINYKVLPDNKLVVTRVKPDKQGDVSVTVVVPGPGKLTALVRSGKTDLSSWTGTISGAKTLHLTLRPSKQGRALLAGKPSTLTLKLGFTPKGGKLATTTIGGLKL
jgi:hypothetical protein